jgi:hypothetical protein
MVTDDGVYQLTDISQNGFCFKCPPHSDVLDEWKTDILTPIGDLKDYFAEKKWISVFEIDDQHFPPLMKVGVKFGQMTKDQQSHLAELINSISEMSVESYKYYL